MGVKRAISITEEKMHSEEPVTILNEIVHNDAIVEKFKIAGVGQSKSVDAISQGIMIVSAHGVAPQVIERAKNQGLRVVDATCPLVIHIHKVIKKLASKGFHIFHFGDPDHDETIGIVGHAPDKVTVLKSMDDLYLIDSVKGKKALTAQSTAHSSDFEELVAEVKKRYPDIEIKNTICNATSKRQSAIIELAPLVDVILVVGSLTSANSKRLAQIGEDLCEHSYLIGSAAQIKPEWLSRENVKTIGLTAGASTPDFLIDGVIKRLKELNTTDIEVIYTGEEPEINKLSIDIED